MSDLCIQALRPPTLAPPTVTPELRVLITVTAFPEFMPEDYGARVEYAIGVGAPVVDSPLWRLAGVLDAPGTVTTSARIPGQTVWTRARGEASGFRPSRWTTPVAAVIGDIPVFFSLTLSSTYELAWTGNAFLGGVRIRWAVDDGTPIIPNYGSAVDRDAADTTFQVPDTPLSGQRLIVQAEAWEGFAMGSVTGGQGMIASVSRTRESSGGTLPTLGDDDEDFSIQLSSSAGWQVPAYTADGLNSFMSLTVDGSAPVFEADGTAAHIPIQG